MRRILVGTFKIGEEKEGRSQEWGLKLYTPTSFNDYNGKSGTVRLTATEA